MFKGTNKTWKALALVLALCMLSTVVVVADEVQPSVITLENTDVTYSDGVVTVTGEINAPETDVTILAVRTTSSTGITLENAAAGSTETVTDKGNVAWSTAMLQQQVVYIDQETATEAATDNFSFSFIPRTGVGGQYITVFVGGANVASPKAVTILAAPAVPVIAPATPWYKGDGEVLFSLKKSADADADAWTKAAADTWFAAVETVTVDGGTDNAKASFTVIEKEGAAYLQYTTAAATVDSLSFVDTDDEYPTAGMDLATAQGRDDRPAGTLTNVTTPVVAGGTAAIPVNTEGAYKPEDWTAGLATATGGTYENGVLSVTVDLADKVNNLEETITIDASVTNYVAKSATVAVIAPTKAAADDATVSSAYTDTIDGGTGTSDAEAADTDTTDGSAEWKTMYGQAVVTLPTPDSGLTYSWAIVADADSTGASVETIADNATSVVLDRPDYVAPASVTESTPKAYNYTLTLTVTAAGYKEATKTFPVSASRVGMKGATVTITPNFTGPTSAAIAASATYTLTPVAGGTPVVITYDGTGFTANAVALGDYTLTIARPGYVTKTIEVTVGAGGIENLTLPEMVAGDATGDGAIDINDFFAWTDAFGATTGGDTYSNAVDFNADGAIDINDFFMWTDSFGYTS
ncbi:MAG: hypothetical protein IJN25_08115 [Clostridia bacterium]|nr:hypothetical protein [Clostridia bacterium]